MLCMNDILNYMEIKENSVDKNLFLIVIKNVFIILLKRKSTHTCVPIKNYNGPKIQSCGIPIKRSKGCM